MCEVIKKINEDMGFYRGLSFIFFQKWLNIVPASADEWPILANDDSECILLQQEINYLDWKFQRFSAWNHWHIQQKANIGKAALPVLEMIGNKWKAEDSLQWWSAGDRWIPMIHNAAPSINFWLGINQCSLSWNRPCNLQHARQPHCQCGHSGYK